MINKRMEEKLEDGRAVDVSGYPREGNYYLMPCEPEFGVDYCDAKDEAWIHSIGRRLRDGVIVASRGAELYQSKDFHCLWLR